MVCVLDGSVLYYTECNIWLFRGRMKEMIKTDRNHSIIPVSVAGGYWTGSSTIVDLLAEHPECAIVPEEFTLFTFGQFFQELYAPIASGERLGATYDANLLRLSEFNRTDMYPIRAIFRRLFMKMNVYPKMFFSRRADMGKRLGAGYRRSCSQLESMLLTIRRDGENCNLEALHELMLEVLSEAAKGAVSPGVRAPVKYGVFDQLVAPPYIKYAEQALPTLRYINIDRDWRDQYVSMREPFRKMMARNRHMGVRPWDENLEVVDNEPIPFFLRLRNKIEKVKAEQAVLAGDNMLWLWYEDVVLDRDSVARQVFDFLDLDQELWTPDQHLHPNISRKRIGKWKKGIWQKEPLKSEIAFLSEKLGVRESLS